MSVQDKKINLVINNLSKEKYAELKRNNQLCADQLYLVNDNQLDAGGVQIINVSEPVNQTDAATKNYVDTLNAPDLNARYFLMQHTPILSSVTIESVTTNAYVCYLSDFTINTVQITANDYPYYMYMPEKTSSKARDFMVRVEVLSAFSTMPTVGFIGNNESCDFESTDDDWASLEVGVNLFNFTETKSGGN